jgi:hypothetical protein
MRLSGPLRMGCSRFRKLSLTKNTIEPWLAIALCAASYAGTAMFWFLRKWAKTGRFTRLVKAGFRECFGDHSEVNNPGPKYGGGEGTAPSRHACLAFTGVRSLGSRSSMEKYSGHPSLRTSGKSFPFSHENGPYTVAKLTRALPSRRLKRGKPRDGVQRVGPPRMLFAVCPIQSQPDGRHHRTKWLHRCSEQMSRSN